MLQEVELFLHLCFWWKQLWGSTKFIYMHMHLAKKFT